MNYDIDGVEYFTSEFDAEYRAKQQVVKYWVTQMKPVMDRLEIKFEVRWWRE